MMSWLSGLASKAENLLNNIDSSAADALGPLRTKTLKMDRHSSDFEPIDSPQNVLYHTTTYRSSSPGVCSHSYKDEEPKRSVSRSPVHDLFNSRKPKLPAQDSWEWDACTHLDDVSATQNKESTPVTTDASTLAIRTVPSNVKPPTSSRMPPSTANITSTSLPAPNDAVCLDIQDHHIGVADSTTPGHFDSAAQARSQMKDDVHMENQLLRSEVSSLGQEVSDLLRRNVKITEENKELRRQLERLQQQLYDSECRTRALHEVVEDLRLHSSSTEVTSSDESADLRNQLALVKSELETVQAQSLKFEKDVKMLSTELQESRHHQELTEKRLQVSLDQVTRVTQELSQYKEKATHVLAMKEELITSLKEAAPNDPHHQRSDGSSSESADSLKRQIHLLRTECDLSREELARWRNEVDHRDLVIHEMETRLQAERESSRHSLETAEQQTLREKQLREDSDAELLLLRNKQRDLEEIIGKQKADLHAQIVANESELNRLRHLLARRHNSSNSDSADEQQVRSNATMLTRTDPEHVITLESRLRQLTDALMTRQDALDSVLAQNHALKIRLERAQSDNESLASTLATECYSTAPALPVRLPYHSSSGYGCARILLHNSVIPRPFHPIVSSLDEVAMRITNLCRKWPLTRLLFFLYLITLHAWLLFASFIFLPSPVART